MHRQLLEVNVYGETLLMQAIRSENPEMFLDVIERFSDDQARC